MKILKVEHGRLKIERLFENKYEETCKEVFEKDNYLLPTYKSIRINYQYPDEVRLILEGTFVEVTTETEVIRCEILKNWLTDFGSVPRKLRSFFDNDGKALWFWILHDAMFGVNSGLKYSNEVLKAGLEYHDLGTILSNAAYLAVQYSPQARKAYRKTQYHKSGQEQFIKITRTPKV